MKDTVNKRQRMNLLETFCSQNGRDLQKFIYAMTRKDTYAAEEIYQNTMLSALKSLEDLRDCEKMKTWIFSIAKAEARRYYASGSLRKASCEILNEDLAGYGHAPDFSKAVDDRECVKELIDCLAREEQQLYILHYYYGLPLKKVSSILKTNYSTVRSMHVRSMKKMRRNWELP